MRLQIPFPYWLWQEVVLTHPPHHKATVFRLISGVGAIGLPVAGYVLGKHLFGGWAGLVLVAPLVLLGYAAGYLALTCTEWLLKALVRKGVLAEPDFQNQKQSDHPPSA